MTEATGKQPAVKQTEERACKSRPAALERLSLAGPWGEPGKAEFPKILPGRACSHLLCWLWGQMTTEQSFLFAPVYMGCCGPQVLEGLSHNQ